MKKIVDEENLYFRIMDEGFRSGHPTFQELLVVAKHFRQVHGYGEKNLVRELGDFCSDRNPHYNLDLSEPILEKVARAAIQSPEFDEVNLPIHISSDELEKIRAVKNFSHQKVLFSALVFSKGSGNPEFFSDRDKDITHFLDMSGENRISISVFVKQISHPAYLANIFEHVIGKKGSYYRIIDAPTGDAVITIGTMDDYDNAGSCYQEFAGGILSWCKTCGEEFTKNSNSQKHCKKCIK